MSLSQGITLLNSHHQIIPVVSVSFGKAIETHVANETHPWVPAVGLKWLRRSLILQTAARLQAVEQWQGWEQ